MRLCFRLTVSFPFLLCLFPMCLTVLSGVIALVRIKYSKKSVVCFANGPMLLFRAQSHLIHPHTARQVLLSGNRNIISVHLPLHCFQVPPTRDYISGKQADTPKCCTILTPDIRCRLPTNRLIPPNNSPSYSQFTKDHFQCRHFLTFPMWLTP